MKLRFVLIFLYLMLSTSPLWAYIPREDVISNASTEAGYSYESAAKGTPQLTSNLYHPNYVASNCVDDPKSPLAKALDWPLDGNGNPEQHSWYGAPYCYGGTVWQSTCQTQITNGEGLGASKCHYDALGSDWATGIDCSFFVCKCFQAAYHSVANLKTVCTKLYDWDPFQPGDLLISSAHVMIYGGFESGSPIVYHASAHEDNERVVKEVLTSISGYEAYRHFNIDPDDNVIVFLSHLTPYADGHGVTIDFATIFEENTSHFALEKYSRENRHFAAFAKIMPKGSGSNYSYIDPSGSPDDLYRLVEVENSGKRNVLELSKVCDQKPNWEYSDIQPPKRDIKLIRSDTEKIIQQQMETRKLPALPSVWNYDWVTIYPDSFADDVSDLNTWRWLQGFTVGGISIKDVISGYGSVNGYVQHLWDTQNHTLEYVCLVGGACISDDPDCEPEDDLIPIDVFEGGLPHGEGGSTRYASDFEVGDVTGDGYPEIAVGRIPAENTYDVVSYINKLIHYESTSPADWTDEVTYFVDAMTHNSCSGVAALNLAEIP